MTGLLDIARQAEQAQLERDASRSRHGLLNNDNPIQRAMRGGSMYGSLMQDPADKARMDRQMLESTLAMMPMAGVTAYHGSPHMFNKFRMDKIGTGEGAQAYGHGLYLAENPKVARGYADTGSRNSQFDSGHRYVIRKGNLYDDAFDIEKMHKGAGASGGYESRSSFFDDSFKSKDEALRFLESKGHVPSGSALGVDDVGNYFVDSRKANLYKVDLPDDQIKNMLDWDKPLGKQSPYIKERALRALKDAGHTDKEDIAWLMKEQGSQTLDWIGSGTKSRASDRLRKHGIPGIKYLDQGSRRFLDGKSGYWKKYGTVREFLQGEYPKVNAKWHEKAESDKSIWRNMFKENNRRAREATRNFVVFDENIPQILERNQQPIGGLLGK